MAKSFDYTRILSSSIILIIFLFFIFFISPQNQKLLFEIETAFSENPEGNVLLSKIITSDWDRVCVDTSHMPPEMIVQNMKNVANYKKPITRNFNLSYVGALYFLKNDNIVEEYVFPTPSFSLDLSPLSINIDNEKYLFLGEGFFENNACKSRNEAHFVSYVDKSFGEPYRKIIFTDK